MSNSSTISGDEQPEVKVVAAVVMDRAGRLLVVRRGAGMAHAGLWELPGGKVEDGETLSDALRREIMEELSYPIEVGEEIFSEPLEVKGRSGSIHFLLARPQNDSAPILSEHDDILWESPDCLRFLALAPGDRGFALWLCESENSLS